MEHKQTSRSLDLSPLKLITPFFYPGPLLSFIYSTFFNTGPYLFVIETQGSLNGTLEAFDGTFLSLVQLACATKMV